MEANSKLIFEADDFEVVGTKGLDAEKISKPSITFWSDVWRRFRANKLSMVGLIILVLVILMVCFGPMISGKDYQFIDYNLKNIKPNGTYWFGTDEMGRDIFTRVCYGGRISIIIGVACTIVSFIIGSALGGIAGYLGGVVDDFLMRVIEIIGSIPYLVLIVILSFVLGRSMFALVFAMTITAWTGTARMVRGQVMQLKQQDFVAAATALGASPARIIVKHLLPNTLGIIIVNLTLSIPSFIFSESFLSYIGLGVQPPETSWGALASLYQTRLMFDPYQLFFPCLMIVLTVLSFHLIGDGLTDALDPKLRK